MKNILTATAVALAVTSAFAAPTPKQDAKAAEVPQESAKQTHALKKRDFDWDDMYNRYGYGGYGMGYPGYNMYAGGYPGMYAGYNPWGMYGYAGYGYAGYGYGGYPYQGYGRHFDWD